MSKYGPFEIVILPRESTDWKTFVATTPSNSIALDGFVRGGPRFDYRTKHFNFDHHNGVIRSVTMSTAMQIFFKIKGGFLEAFKTNNIIHGPIYIFINDTDQDTALAIWLLLHYAEFEGIKGIPSIHRLLTLTDRLDITGGAFPMNLRGELEMQHAWVFGAYNELRKTGGLAQATMAILQDNLDATLSRLDRFMMNQAEQQELDTSHKILVEYPGFKIVDEVGGSEARYYLFSHDLLQAFVAIIGRRSDGRLVCSVGKKSDSIPFSLSKFYRLANRQEGLSKAEGWNGSDLIGGSSRKQGTGLSLDQLTKIGLACQHY